MVILLHGDNIVASRNELERVKKEKVKEVLAFDGGKIGLTELKQALEAGSLFGQERIVILENFLPQKPNAAKNQIVEYLKNLETSVDLILWEGRELEKKLLDSFHDAKKQLFRLDPVLFKFLDSLKPGCGRIAVTLLREVLRREEVELVFYMLVRQFRILLALCDLQENSIPEVTKLGSWQKEKLVKQANSFGVEALLKIYHQLLEIDLKLKTGLSPFNLLSTLELFCATL